LEWCNDWGVFGLATGAYGGYKDAASKGLNPWTGGLNSSDRQIWLALKNGSISPTDATAQLHGDYYINAGNPDVVLGNSERSRGSFIPLDANGKELGIIEASRDYSSVGGRITINPAGMTSGRRFLFTTYHELTHAQMFFNGDMHIRYNFLAMNYGTGIKTSLPRPAYYQAGLKTYAERWAYGAQWARWGINGSRINYVGSTWQDLLKLYPTQVNEFNNLMRSF